MKKNKSPAISIIIPVYNSEKYITRCIESIIASSFSDYEILIIDGKSKDNTPLLIKSFVKHYKNIHLLIDKEDTGPGGARNIGIKHARGKHIMFIDSDDWIEKNYLTEMNNAMRIERERGEPDIVISGYKIIDNYNKPKSVILSSDNWSKYRNVSPWGHIYNANFLKKNNILFEFDNCGEDVFFNAKAYSLAKYTKTISSCGYIYTINSSSLSHGILNNYSKTSEKTVNLLEALLALDSPKKNPNEYYYFIIKNICYHIICHIRYESIKNIRTERKKFTKFLDKKIPNWRNYVTLSSPKGETILVRIIVYIFAKIWSRI